MRLLISAVLLSSLIAHAAAANTSIESVDPRIGPVEVAFLKQDVAEVVECLSAAAGNCGFAKNELSSLGRDEVVRLTSVPAHAEFTSGPDTVHVIFRQPNGAASAVVMYLRTERGLERSSAVIAS